MWLALNNSYIVTKRELHVKMSLVAINHISVVHEVLNDCKKILKIHLRLTLTM